MRQRETLREKSDLIKRESGFAVQESSYFHNVNVNWSRKANVTDGFDVTM